MMPHRSQLRAIRATPSLKITAGTGKRKGSGEKEREQRCHGRETGECGTRNEVHMAGTSHYSRRVGNIRDHFSYSSRAGKRCRLKQTHKNKDKAQTGRYTYIPL